MMQWVRYAQILSCMYIIVAEESLFWFIKESVLTMIEFNVGLYAFQIDTSS